MHVVNKRHPKRDKEEKGSHLIRWVASTYLESGDAFLASYDPASPARKTEIELPDLGGALSGSNEPIL